MMGKQRVLLLSSMMPEMPATQRLVRRGSRAHRPIPHRQRGVTRRILFLLLACAFLFFSACGRTDPSGTTGQPSADQSSSPTAIGGETGSIVVESPATVETKPAEATPDPRIGAKGGLTAAEAAALVWPKAKEGFGDAVLWRIIPTDDNDSTKMQLDPDWQKNGRSSAWFIWYADPAGENWFMFRVVGKKIKTVDIGTRDWNAMDMPAEWPRAALPVDLPAALAAAKAQGADLDGLTWLEYTLEAGASGYGNRPMWMFACTTELSSGNSLQYRMFVDATTGMVAGAVNLLGDEMSLPIDLEALAKPRAEDHRADLEKFFGFIADKTPDWAVRQLSNNLCPNEATAQMWLANFQSLTACTVKSIVPDRLEEWTAEWEAYKVELDVSTAEPPDRYGWENGANVRWVVLIPQGAGGWKVEALSANP